MRKRTWKILVQDQFHLQGGENPLPVLVACLIQLMAELLMMPDPSRQAVEGGTRTDIGSIGHGQLPFAIRAHRPLIQIFVVCLHKIGVFQFIYRNKDTEKVRIRQRSTNIHLLSPYIPRFHTASTRLIPEETGSRTFVIENRSIPFSIFNF